MATLNDIARDSGFSKTLVARAINGKPGVSEESKQKILEVAEKLNYKPNLLAKALITNRTNAISVVLDNLCSPFYFKLIEAIEDTAGEAGYKVFFCSPNQNDSESKKKYIEYFTQGMTDGIIFYGSKIEDVEHLKDLVKSDFPSVIIESKLDMPNVNNVLIDNFNFSRSAVEYLINQGHKKIYHFMGDGNKEITFERARGYEEEMKSHGLESYIKLIKSDFSAESGYEFMTELIKNNDIPEAIFFSGDATGYGAIKAIYELDIDLMKKIGMIGFDEDAPPNDGILYPKLSTVRQPMYEIGQIATEILLKKIADKDTESVVEVVKPTLLIKET